MPVSDCAHDREPSCAVLAALADGSLPADRWANYAKLQRELRSLEVRRDKGLLAEERRRRRAFNRSLRRSSY